MNTRLFSVIYMFCITLFFTSLVTGVKIFSQERIDTNQQVKLQRIILKVLQMPVKKDASDEQIIVFFKHRIKAINVKDTVLYVGYGNDGKKIQGYAFPVGGPGFWGPIYGMVGVNDKASKILGIAFYKHSETPGLGGRMTEPWFTGQFEGLRLHPVTGDKKIFYLKPAGTSRAPNELDAITGATGTSRAIETFLNRDLRYFIEDLWGSLEKG